MPSLDPTLLKVLGTPKYRKEDEATFQCPLCGSRSRKLEVNLRKGAFHCFRCKAGGSVRTLLRLLVGSATPHPRAATVRIYPPDKARGVSLGGPGKLPPGYVPVHPEDAAPHGVGRGPGVAVREAARHLLQDRCVSPSRFPLLRPGVSPVYPLRVIIPLFMSGRCVSFIARSMRPSIKPKELSPAGPREEGGEWNYQEEKQGGDWDRGWWNRSQIVYNFDDPAVESAPLLAVTEGIFDVEALANAGIPAVSVLGSGVSKNQAGLIVSKNPKTLVLVPDGDEGGSFMFWDALDRLMRRLPSRTRFLVAVMPEGKDPHRLSADLNRHFVVRSAVDPMTYVRYCRRQGWRKPNRYGTDSKGKLRLRGL